MIMQNILNLLGFNISPIKAVNSIIPALAWGWSALVLILLFLLPLIIYTYKCEGKKLSKRNLSIIISLRIIWMVLIAVVLTGPVIVVSGYIPQRNHLAVVVDTSRSMSIKSGDSSRIEQIKQLFTKGFVKRIEEKTGIYPEIFSFADNVSPVSRQEIEQFNLRAEGNQTDISGAIHNITGNLGEGSLLGIIMLTDGANTIGENPLVAVENIRTPVHFIAPEGNEKSTDLSLQLQRPPSMGFLNSSIRISGEVILHNIATNSVKVMVTRDGKEFTSADAQILPETGRAPFAFNIPCNEEGAFRFELQIPELPNELTTENNKAGFLLKVVRERLNILAISGHLSWDMKFIATALSTDPNIKLVRWSKVTDGRWICSRDQKPESGVNEPKILNDLKDADVIIVDSVPFIDLKVFEKELCRKVEAESTGLFILPGSQSFAELGYRGSEFEKMLPVNIENETWRGIPGNYVLQSPDVPYNFLRLVDNPVENVEFFATLPKLEGAYEYKGLKPGSEVLISSTIRGNSNMLPLLVKTRYGQGTIAMLTGGPIWPAGFRLVPTDRGFAPFSALIVNMCKWLANRKEDAQVSIETASSRAWVGQPFSIKVWVTDSKRQLLSNAQVTLTIKDEKANGNSLAAIETSDKGCYEAAFVAAYRGLHHIDAEARYQGRELGKAVGEILVEAPTAEFDEPVVKVEMMRQLASSTGGVFADIAHADTVIEAIDNSPGQKLETKIVDIRDSWVILLLLLTLPMAEWYLRRTRGLS